MLSPQKLSNNLKVHLIPQNGTKAVTVLVLAKVGSRYEYPEINGAAHFIEHLMFKGTQRRPRTLDISRALDAYGAEYNAYTGKDLTGYYVKIDSNHTELAIDLLHDMLFHSKYEAEEIDRERQVIKEEINMYTDNPIMHVEELLEEQVFEGDTLAWNIAGSHKTINEMTRDQIIAFRDEYYVPSNMVIAVAGNIPENSMELLEKTFGQIPTKDHQPKSFSAFTHPNSRERAAKTQHKETEQIQVMLGFPGVGLSSEKLPTINLLSIILGGLMSSRLFVEVRERRGLAYMVRSGHEAHEDTGLLTIQSGLDQSRLPLALETIINETEKIKNNIEEHELTEAKDHLYGKILLKLEDSSNQAEWFGKQELFLQKAKTPEEWIEDYKKVTIDQIIKVANEVLNADRMGISAIGPYKNGDEFLEKANLKPIT